MENCLQKKSGCGEVLRCMQESKGTWMSVSTGSSRHSSGPRPPAVFSLSQQMFLLLENSEKVFLFTRLVIVNLQRPLIWLLCFLCLCHAGLCQEPEQSMTNSEPVTPSEEDAAEAEKLKAEGNEQMKAENFESAISYYGKAIELNPSNAVYYCNRAAAYSKLGNYAGAVRDCERAINIDPKYSKAYGRMGLALSSLNKLSDAVVYYRKALELDPDNETYKSNLKVTEQKMKEAPSPTGGTGGFDLAGLLNNPGFMSMASNLMNNPQVQQLMSGMISGGQNPMATPGTSPSPNDLASLIQAGQQFAQQMQQQNPELIEQLRSQIRSRTPSASNEEQQE